MPMMVTSQVVEDKKRDIACDMRAYSTDAYTVRLRLVTFVFENNNTSTDLS